MRRTGASAFVDCQCNFFHLFPNLSEMPGWHDIETTKIQAVRPWTGEDVLAPECRSHQVSPHNPESISRALVDSQLQEQLRPTRRQDWMFWSVLPIGDFFAPNLTPIHLADWSDGEIIRAIREGIHRSGRSLLIMPFEAWHHLSDDDDLQAINAHQQIPHFYPRLEYMEPTAPRGAFGLDAFR